MSRQYGDCSVDEISLLDMDEFTPAAASVETGFDVNSKGVEDFDFNINDNSYSSAKLTMHEWQKISEEAYQEGFQKGFEEGKEKGSAEGLAQGLDQGQAEMERRLSTLSSMVSSLQKPLNDQQHDLENLLLSLVIKIAKETVNNCVIDNESMILDTLHKAINEIPPSSHDVVVRIHPSDVGIISAQAKRNDWVIKEDDSITRGGFKIESGSCSIDSTIEARFDQVVEQYSSALSPNSNKED